MEINKRTSNTIWELKGFFIFTILFAHMPLLWGGVFETMRYYIGIIGVPSFLMMSGYFDYESKTPLLRRLKKLLIPLLIWGTLTYGLDLIPHFSKDQSFMGVLYGWLKWTYGCGTWLYFVPMLLWCMLLSRYVNKWILIVLGIVSTALGVTIIPYNDAFTPYVNPFNFILYFLLGRITREYHWNWERNWLVIVSFIIATASLWIWNEDRPHYFHLCCIPFCLSIFIIAWNIFSKVHWAWAIWIGKVSFVIYFCHMQIAGITNTTLSLLWGSPLELLKYPIAIIIVLLFVYILYFVLNKFNLTIISKYLGFR